jgi:hypothetical protein
VSAPHGLNSQLLIEQYDSENIAVDARDDQP